MPAFQREWSSKLLLTTASPASLPRFRFPALAIWSAMYARKAMRAGLMSSSLMWHLPISGTHECKHHTTPHHTTPHHTASHHTTPQLPYYHWCFDSLARDIEHKRSERMRDVVSIARDALRVEEAWLVVILVDAEEEFTLAWPLRRRQAAFQDALGLCVAVRLPDVGQVGSGLTLRLGLWLG